MNTLGKMKCFSRLYNGKKSCKKKRTKFEWLKKVAKKSGLNIFSKKKKKKNEKKRVINNKKNRSKKKKRTKLCERSKKDFKRG